MVQNKKFIAGMAFIAGLAGMAWSGAALALPEVFVGSRVMNDGVVASAQVATAGSADAEDADDRDAATEDDTQSTSN